MKRNEDKPLEKCIADNLMRALEDRGLTEDDLVLDGVVGRSSINAYLSMSQLPTLRTAYRIANYLGVTVDWLCGFDEIDDSADYILKNNDNLDDARARFYEALDKVSPDDSEAPWGRLEE